jgi:Tfp pilus assembly protein PilX
MQTNSERGIALILALFLMTALSVLGASLMFLSQTETYASLNYRVMSQARYAAEAGVQKAANFLLDPAQYPIPTAGGGTDPVTAYDRTKSPVQYNGADVVLSTTVSASNYPITSVKTNFAAAAQGTLAAGNATLTYKATAKLIAMQQFESYGGGQAVVQTWEVTSDGGMSGSPQATVEVVGQIETPKVPANSMAAFATYNGCDAIYFHGNTTIDSYDSSEGPPGNCPTCSTEQTDGDVGTNGNLHIAGSVAIDGHLYTPRLGVGSCTAGAITGESVTGGSASVEGGTVPLPKAVTYPPPIFSATPPTTAVTVNSGSLANVTSTTAACTALGLTYGTLSTTPVGNCSVPLVGGVPAFPAGTLIVDGHGTDVTMPSVTVDGVILRFEGASPAANVNINSLGGSGNIEVDANVASALNQAVVLKVAGKNPTGVTSPGLDDPTDMVTPIDLASLGWKQNAGAPADKYDAAALQIVYPGTGTISMVGNPQAAATIYAPNATFALQGTADLFGSVLAKKIDNGGNASIHYDRRLQSQFFVVGQAMMATFSWKRSS